MEILTSDLMTETAFDCDQRPGFVVNELPPTTAKKTPQSSGIEDCGVFCSATYLIVTARPTEGMPFATTSTVLAPVSIVAGISNRALTSFDPVAMPIVLKV